MSTEERLNELERRLAAVEQQLQLLSACQASEQPQIDFYKLANSLSDLLARRASPHPAGPSLPPA